jgi:hypothetical protein
MSGYKHTTIKISEADYRRLHNADMKGRFSRVSQKKVDPANPNVEKLQSTFQGFEQRQREFQQFMRGLSTEIGQVEIETAQALVDQRDGFHLELSDRLASLQIDSTIALDAVSRDLSEQIDLNQRRHSDQLSNLTGCLDSLFVNKEQKAGIAQQWFDSASSLRDFIEAHYDHNRFMPGHFERLDIQIQQALGNLQDDMLEAALLAAQEVYMECSLARLELEKLEGEWQILYQEASEMLEELIRVLAGGKIIPALDTQGQVLPIEINLDHWSDHHYTTLTQQVRYLRSRMRTEAASFTTAELNELVNDVIPGMKKEFDNLVYEARLAVIYSQIRINIADITIQALERQGFLVNEHGFAENNMQMPYLISLQNIEGSQVFIRVNPIRNAQAANDLEIESHDKDVRTESELRSRSREILNSLTQYGLRVGPVRTDRVAQVQGFNAIPERERVPTRSYLNQEDRHD